MVFAQERRNLSTTDSQFSSLLSSSFTFFP